MTSDLNM